MATYVLHSFPSSCTPNGRDIQIHLSDPPSILKTCTVFLGLGPSTPGNAVVYTTTVPSSFPSAIGICSARSSRFIPVRKRAADRFAKGYSTTVEVNPNRRYLLPTLCGAFFGEQKREMARTSRFAPRRVNMNKQTALNHRSNRGGGFIEEVMCFI